MAKGDSLTIRPLGPIVQALSRYSQQLFKPPDDTIRGISPDTWYSPLQPVQPIAPEGTEARAFQYWAGQNLLWTPRSDAEYSAADLKELARYPLARIAIENVKDCLCKARCKVQPRPEPGEPRKAAIKRGLGDKGLVKINRFFEMPDREHMWPDWLRPLLDDMLVIDAWTILVRKTFSGEIVELPVIRGDTIVRYIDENGFTPMPPSPAYAQNWWGIPLVNLTTDQLIYKPRNIVPRNTVASQLYGLSPTEALAPEIEIGRDRMAFTAAYYKEGSIPGVVQVVPRGTSPDKISEAMQWMNSELAGNLAARRQWRLVQGFNEPGADEQILFTKEPLLTDAFDELHIKKIAFGYGISPQRLTRQMNRASADASQEASEIEGLLPYFVSLKSLIDFIIQRKFGYVDYEMVFDPLSEPDQKKQMEVVTAYVDAAIITRNEARDKIGEEASSDPFADKLMVTGSGAVLLGETTAPAGPDKGAGNVPGAKPNGQGAAKPAEGEETGTGAEGEEGGAGGSSRVAEPRKPASANKSNGGKALEAHTQTRVSGFTSGTIEPAIIELGKYDEDQPRDPAGSDTGGQWSSGDSIDDGKAVREDLERSNKVRARIIENHLKREGIDYKRHDSGGGSTYFTLKSENENLDGKEIRVSDHGAKPGGGYAGEDELGPKGYGDPNISNDPSAKGSTTEQTKQYISDLKAGKNPDIPRRPETDFEIQERAAQRELAHQRDREVQGFLNSASDEDKRQPSGSAKERRQAVIDIARRNGVSAGIVAAAHRRMSNSNKMAKATVKLVENDIAIVPGRLAPDSILARVGFEKALTKRFQGMGRKAVKGIAKGLELPHAHIQKADVEPDPALTAAEAATLQAVLKSLAKDWQAIADSADLYLTEASLVGANLGGMQLEITSEGMLGGANTVAGDWARQRSAELVGMRRLKDGRLVQNPNAKWAITNTTRDKLRRVITDLFGKEQATLREVETAIEQAGIFSPERATTIAQTEIARAQTEGNLASWRASGLVQQVKWQLSSLHDQEDICDELAEGSPYPIMKVPELPAHPSCLCSLVLVSIEPPKEEKS